MLFQIFSASCPVLRPVLRPPSYFQTPPPTAATAEPESVPTPMYARMDGRWVMVTPPDTPPPPRTHHRAAPPAAPVPNQRRTEPVPRPPGWLQASWSDWAQWSQWIEWATWTGTGAWNMEWMDNGRRFQYTRRFPCLHCPAHHV
ncbi:MAG: hypothetical protein GY832_37590 [Chloroflexi bacterium]|nr:hypothetical protein [Chloroflexota bacterium]